MRIAPSVLGLALAVFFVSPSSAASACIVHGGERVAPLVELYTSEGCSSCPPADRWFSQQVGTGGANWLAFHVDYWDAIGWRDRFGDASYSRRQRSRVAAAGQSVVYTPQVMIGSQVQAPWRTSVEPMLADAATPALAGLTLRYDGGPAGGELAIGAARAGRAGVANVWLAQYSDGESTRVAAGENAGATLHHDHVARKLWGPWALGATPVSRRVVLRAPSPRWGVVAFVQDAKGRVWQSLELPAGRCVAQ